jgi:glycine cleavage system H lipoate-binding protein
VRIGLDAFAARIAGRPRAVVMERAGTRLGRGQPCAWLDVAGGTLSIRSPLAGKVLSSNPLVVKQPELLADDPYGEGWLFDFQPTDLDRDLLALRPATDFAAHVARDAATWRQLARRALLAPARGQELGQTLQDGGEPTSDLDVLLGSHRRCALAARFLGKRRRIR